MAKGFKKEVIKGKAKKLTHFAKATARTQDLTNKREGQLNIRPRLLTSKPFTCVKGSVTEHHFTLRINIASSIQAAGLLACLPSTQVDMSSRLGLDGEALILLFMLEVRRQSNSTPATLMGRS